jgi:hypothetical protein
MIEQTLPAAASSGLPSRAILRRIVVFDILLPLATVIALQRYGAAPIATYTAASFFPALSIVISWFGRRSVDVVGIGVLAGIAGGLIMALLTDDPRFGLVRAAPAFGLFGLACFASLLMAQPLMFFVARGFAADGDKERLASWNERIKTPAFRRIMRRITAVWGAGALAQAIFGVAVAFLAPASVAIVLEPAMAIAIIGGLLAWSRTLQRRPPNWTSNQQR